MNRSERLVLLDNALREATAKEGGRPASRREFIRTSAGLFLFVAAPLQVTSTGCDPDGPPINQETVQQILQLAFLVAEAAILIGQIIKGDLRIDSPNTQCRTYEIVMQLASVASNGPAPTEQTQKKSICKGEQLFSLEDWPLTPEMAGQYVLKTAMDGKAFESDPFTAMAGV